LKHVCHLTLLFVFLFAQLFGYLYWKQERLVAKNDASIVILDVEKEDLITLTFHKTQLHTLDWEHSKEFSFQDKMYDVVSFSTKGDSISYLCYADEKETWIVHEMEELLNECFGNSSNPEEEEQDSEQRFELFALNTSVWQYQAIQTLEANQRFPYFFNYCSLKLKVAFVPPQTQLS
jgi:hypothetical protein